VIYLFDRVEPGRIVRGARHPRNNPDWPEVGIFAQRGKNRPNRIGTTVCRLLRVEGTRLWVAELDAIDGTPVLDIKPVMREFLPRGELRQPGWSVELMRDYWRTPG
jgi:tRNA (Thr-GGU) A37 N-methylase